MKQKVEKQQQQQNVSVFGKFGELVWYRISFADLPIPRHKKLMLVQDTHVRFVTGTRSKTRFLCKVNKLKVRCIHISHLNLNNLHNVLSHNNYSVSCKYKTLHVFQKLLQAFRLLSEVSLVSSTGDAFAHLIIWHCKRNEFGELYLNIYTKHILLTAPYKSCRSHSPSYCVQKLLRLDAIRGKIVQFLAKHVFDKNMCRCQMLSMRCTCCYHKHLPYKWMEYKQYSGSMCM